MEKIENSIVQIHKKYIFLSCMAALHSFSSSKLRRNDQIKWEKSMEGKS